MQNSYPVKKREELDLRIEKLAFGGKGVGRINDYVIFVENTLPGDLVRARIIKRKSNYAQARLLKILESSGLRQDAPCPYFGWCGGCKVQNLSYAQQLKIKKEQVEESISHIAGLVNTVVSNSLPSKKIWGYRNKMEFSFSDRRWILPDDFDNNEIDRNFALGLHIPGTYDKILQIDNCLLQSEEANRVLQTVSKYCQENNLKPYGIHSHIGFLRFLVIRQSNSTGNIMVNIVTGMKEPELLRPLAEQLEEMIPEVSSVVNTINLKKAQVAFGDEEILLSGQDHITDKIGYYEFKISANSFFQTNTTQAEQLYNIVMEFAKLSGKEIVWDLYAGTGTISLFLAKKSKFVYAFELVQSAIQDAIANANRYQQQNIEFVSGDLLENLQNTAQNPEVIVVDPPRSGMHPKVCEFLTGIKAERIVYVSCNPTTLARDLEILSENYQISRVQPVDMFPHTYHIESVTLLEKLR